jgi:hypothetical protein
MRPVWIALAAILATSLLGALLLARALDRPNHPKPLLAPRGARVIGDRPLGTDRRIVTWRLGGHAEEPSTGLYGVTAWQGKHRLYSHRAAPVTYGIYVETGDFGGDGRNDALLFEDHDGSGGCGVYRAIVSEPTSMRQVNARVLCVDRGSIHLRRESLIFRIGVRKNPRTADNIHCCYEVLRTTMKRWNGRRLVVMRTLLRRLTGQQWPPGGFPPGRT